MADGTVIWFNPKGFGMIAPDDQSADVFVHFSCIERSGRRELTEGERVTFGACQHPKVRGPRASDRLKQTTAKPTAVSRPALLEVQTIDPKDGT